jgi:phosphoserine phosphatase
MTTPTTVALIYDFDGTLAPGNMQEHSFIPALGMDKETFWREVSELTRQHDADGITVYMWHMLERARQRGLAVTAEMLAAHGRTLTLFAGVTAWFDRINAFGAAAGLALEHYIISSGIGEMIEGCAIRHHFRHIFASRFLYADGTAVWPGTVINYTTKTQHLFRINKGILNCWDHHTINRWIEPTARPVPFEQMVFIGDGETDIPAMKMVRSQGGHSIAVFDPAPAESTRTRTLLDRLIAEDRVNFVAPADYSEGSLLDVTVRGILGRIARTGSHTPS